MPPWVRALSVVCAVATIAGCGSSLPTMRATLAASPTINPDPRGRPSPVVVRVFELKSLAAFDAADFFSLFEKDQEALGGEAVWREEFQLRPGESRQYQRPLQPEVKFIGAVAGFRDLEGSRWRSTAPIPVKKIPLRKDVSVAIDVQAQAVTVAVK